MNCTEDRQLAVRQLGLMDSHFKEEKRFKAAEEKYAGWEDPMVRDRRERASRKKTRE